MWSPRIGRSSSSRIDCQVVFAKPSMAATALESATRLSKLVEVDVKLLIAPYKAELPRSRNLLYAQRNSASPATERDAPIGRPSRAIKERSSLSLHTCKIGACFLQARPARAVQFGNTMGGALEEDWVDVGQIGAATTAITGL